MEFRPRVVADAHRGRVYLGFALRALCNDALAAGAKWNLLLALAGLSVSAIVTASPIMKTRAAWSPLRRVSCHPMTWPV